MKREQIKKNKKKAAKRHKNLILLSLLALALTAGWYVFTDIIGADQKFRLWEILNNPSYTYMRIERVMLKEGIRRAFPGLLHTDTGGIN